MLMRDFKFRDLICPVIHRIYYICLEYIGVLPISIDYLYSIIVLQSLFYSHFHVTLATSKAVKKNPGIIVKCEI